MVGKRARAAAGNPPHVRSYRHKPIPPPSPTLCAPNYYSNTADPCKPGALAAAMNASVRHSHGRAWCGALRRLAIRAAPPQAAPASQAPAAASPSGAASRPFAPPAAPPPSQEALEALAQLILSSRRLLVISGAGISTESGVPDYRSPSGAYSTGFKPMSHQDFLRNAKNRARYWERSFWGWRRFAAAKPNAAHSALALLEQLVSCLRKEQPTAVQRMPVGNKDGCPGRRAGYRTLSRRTWTACTIKRAAAPSWSCTAPLMSELAGSALAA